MKRLIGCIALGLITIVASAQWTNPSDDVPAYNATAPRKALPAILSGNQLTGIYFTHHYQVVVYEMAAKIPAVLHQQPCYCHCDRALGHNSLHSCFCYIRRRQRQKRKDTVHGVQPKNLFFKNSI